MSTTHTTTAAGTGIYYALKGDLLSTNAEATQADLSRLMASHSTWRSIELDLRAARIVDSVGLNLIVSLIRTARPAGRTVRLLVSNPNVRRVMAFTRIDQHAEVVLSENA